MTAATRHRPTFRASGLLIVLLISAASAVQAQPSFQKTFVPDAIGPGSTSLLVFEIDNTSSVPATDLAFTTNLPAGVVLATPAAPFTDCTNGLVSAADGGGLIGFTDGSLAAFEQCAVSVQVTAANPGTYTSVSGDLTSSQGNSGPVSDDLEVLANRPGFSKSFSPSQTPFGGRTTLTFFIDSSLNPDPTLNLRFNDPLPPGLIIADPANVTNTCNGGSITALPGSGQFDYAPAFFGGASVAAGSVCQLSVDVVPSINLPGAEPVINTTGELTSQFTGPAVSSGLATAPLQPDVSGNLILVQEFLDDPVLPGAIVDVRFTIQNLDRDHGLTAGSFTSDLDLMLTGLQATETPLNDVCGSGSSLSGTSVLTLNGANLPAEGSCSFELSLQVPADAANGSSLSTTTALSGLIDGMPSQSEPPRDALFVSDAPVLSKQFLNNPAGSGETVTMEFTIDNLSPTDAATDIAFSDNLAAFYDGVQVTALPTAGFCGGGSIAFTSLISGSLFLNVSGASLAPGDSCTFTVDLLLPVSPQNQSLTNVTSMLASTVGSGSSLTTSAQADLTVIGGPRLDKQFVPGSATPGGTVNLEFTVSLDEDAPGEASAITFSDDLDAALSGLSAVDLPLNDVCGVGSQLSGTGTLTLAGGTLQPGQNCTFSATLELPAAASPGEYTSLTSSIDAVIQGVTATAPAAADILSVGGLTFDLAFIDDPALPGGTLTARYTINNSGTADVSDVFFTHNVGAALSGLAAPGPLPANPCGAGSTISGTSLLVLTGGNLAAGTSCTFDIPLSVPAAASDGQYGSSTSNLQATVGGSAVVLPPANDQFSINGSLLFLEHAYTNDPVVPGGAVTLEYTLSNLDAAHTVSGVSFSHDLDATLPGLAAVALPANDVCGAGSQISGTGLLTLTGGNLAPGSSCTFQVDVVVPAAAAAGSYPSTTSAITGTASGSPVTGPGSAAALDVQSFDFSKSFINSPVDIGSGPAVTTLQFELSNNGSLTASNLAFTDDLDAVLPGLVATNLPLTDVCGAESTLSGTSVIALTGGNLPPGGNCNFSVDVQTPGSATGGTYTNTTSDLNAVGLPVAGPAVADLVLFGQPQLLIAPPVLDFGAQRVGTTSALLTVNISNTGNDDLNVTSIDAAAGAFSLSAGTCPAAPFSLAPADSCSLSYQFAPAMEGPALQTLSIASNAPNSPGSFDLQGTGVQPGLTIAPALLDFGDQLINTSSGSLTATLSSSGTAAVQISALTPPAGDFSVVSSSCDPVPFNLPIGSSCSIDYQFAPTTTGPALSTISVTSDAPTSVDTFELAGNGTEGVLSLSTTAVDFPDTNLLDAISTVDLLVSNSGDGPLTITAITDPLAPFVIDTGARGAASCGPPPITLAPAADCTLQLLFDPDTLGDASSSFDLVSNSAGSPDTVTLTGRGVQAILTLGASSLAFPDTEVGMIASETLLLENTGNIDLSVNLNDDPGQPFTVLPDACGSGSFSLTPAGSCSIEVQFEPTAPGDFSADFDIDNDSGNGPENVALSGRGLQGELSLDMQNLDFPITGLGESTTLDVSLSNTGSSSLTVSELIGPAAPFAIEASNCGATPFILDVAESCTLTISFSPNANGVFDDTVEVVHDGANSPTFIGLSGNLRALPVPVNSRPGLILLVLLMAGLATTGLRRPS